MRLKKNILNCLKYIFYIFNFSKKINKIGFFINEEYILDHYLNILDKLDINNFELVISDHLKKNIYFMRTITNSYNYVFLSDALFFRKYKIFITHLSFGGKNYISHNFFNRIKILFYIISNRLIGLFNDENKYSFNLQKIIGKYNIKFMYGVDDGGSYYNDYNKVYDEFYCHGPIDAKNIRHFFNKPTFQIGYPKYDKYFENLNNYSLKKKIKSEFSCDQNLKTILWICTKSKYFSTIETYAEHMKKLSKKFNIILRPHPAVINLKHKEFRQKTYDIANSSHFKLSNKSNQIMFNLFLISDYVFCDYGGSIFGAIYLEKKILLMNSKFAKDDNTIFGINFKSNSIKSRKFLPYVENDQVDFESLITKLDSDYEINRVKEAKKIYFGKTKKNCSEDVVRKLLQTYKKLDNY